jgi:hypothetical protein
LGYRKNKTKDRENERQTVHLRGLDLPRSYFFFPAGFLAELLGAPFFVGFFFVVGSPPLSDPAISIPFY